MLLAPIRNNDQGDLLLECHTDPSAQHPAYQVVFRVATQTYEPRPGTQVQGWSPPAGESPAARPLGHPARTDVGPAPAAQSPGAFPPQEPVGIILLDGAQAEVDGRISTPAFIRGERLFVCHYCAQAIEPTPTWTHSCPELQAAYDAMVQVPDPPRTKKSRKRRSS